MAVGCGGKTSYVFLLFVLVIRLGWGRDHHVELEEEVRQTIELSKFGFLQNGILRVNFSDLIIRSDGHNDDVLVGFSLEKTGSDGISPYMEQHSEKCILKDQSQVSSNPNQISLAVIKFDLSNRHILIDKIGSDFLNLTIDGKSALPTTVLTMSVSSATLPTSSSAKTGTLATVPSSQAASTTLMPNSNSSSTPKLERHGIPTSQVPSTTSNLTAPSKDNSVPQIKTTNPTSLPDSNSNISTQAHSSAEHRAARKRRNARREGQTLPLYRSENNVSHHKYSGKFVVQVKSKAEEGLYNLYFHNCPVHNKKRVPVAIQIDIVEKNGDNFLSAGEEPLPYMFGVLSALFFGTAIYWLHVLRKNRQFTYKVHYMMFVLVLLKSLDLMFQAVNYHFISIDGKPAESWEVLYYITHLLKGALLFTTIVLIGTGYFFIKHVLSDRDKKIFMIVIPLQILANTAQIVMESTEEASTQYTTWKELFILVDLLCCGAILFPVVWSIRHLQEGSQTDGKAALNLAKLKLFRHFYVMIVCYIYFTRIIVYLIKITVPFQYMWLDDFFNNAASYVFFVLTGYKFRPAPDNPYLHVPQGDSDDELEMEEAVTSAGLADGVTRLQPSSDGKRIFETA